MIIDFCCLCFKAFGMYLLEQGHKVAVLVRYSLEECLAFVSGLNCSQILPFRLSIHHLHGQVDQFLAIKQE